MAGASSSAEDSRKYQVFINFRGADTRRRFVCHLYHALNLIGVETFIDSVDLQKGDSLSELFEAIKDSKISIVVFSKDYASSEWCLKELVRILECRDQQSQIVVPVFYEVETSDVRELKGRFGEAFAKAKHESKFGNDVVKRWKSDLTRVTHFHGWVRKIYKDDHELIKIIVDDILKKLKDISPSKTDGLIGMDFHMDKIDSLWKQGKDDCTIVGIWGMGGLGKSTIARAVYGKIGADFDHKCFLDNVKEGFLTTESKLQMVENFVCTTLNRKNQGNSVESLRESLRGKKVLFVLDNVDKVDQIETLIGDSPSNSFGGGSRIIITTRDKQLLAGYMIYEPKLLNPEEALKLFCRYAFRTVPFSERYEAISKRAVKYAHGLPLALKVLGAMVHSKTVEDWEDVLKKIDEISITSLDSEIGGVLRASFDALDELEKKIFLDIACFFGGEPIDKVTEFLESCKFFPVTGLKGLVDKSLLTFSGGCLKMHYLIQEMGRDIVRQESIKEPGGRSRLWYHEDVLEVLAQNTGTQAVEGIILDLSKVNEVVVNNEAFVGMKRLRMLQLSAKKDTIVYDDEECKQQVIGDKMSLSNELRVLIWHGCPLKSLNLIQIDMRYSHTKQLWERSKPCNLVKMDLSYSKDLITIPDFSKAKKLKWLYLTGCTSLLQVDPYISAVNSLIELNLSGCSNLKRLPSSWRYMKELRSLKLDSTAITEVPSSINDLPALQSLSLCDCSELISLPSNIHMKSLEFFNLGGCSKLAEFPEILGAMQKLEQLILDGTAIKKLPSSIDHLTGLFRLSMRNCTKLVNLPEEICNLKWLELIDLTGCSKVEELPQNIGNPMSTRFMDDVVDPYNLRLAQSGVKQLPFSILRVFKVSCKGCKDIKAPFSSWPTWNHQRSSDTTLSTLDLSDCNLLELSDAIAHLSLLRRLDLSGNEMLERLPATMNRLRCLEELRLEGCMSLESIPELSPRIKFIFADNCTSLKTVSTPRLPCAQAYGFQFFDCSKLVNVNLFTDIAESVIDNQESFEIDDFQKYSYGSGYHCMYLPGSDIPDWFNNRNIGTSVTVPVQLPPGVVLQAFAICAISNLRGAWDRRTLEFAYCFATFKTTVGQEKRFYFRLFPEPHPSFKEILFSFESDHMFLACYHSSGSGEFKGISECTEATFKIVACSSHPITNDSTTWEECTWITSCGVRLFCGSKAPRNKRKRETQERGKEKIGVQEEEFMIQTKTQKMSATAVGNTCQRLIH